MGGKDTVRSTHGKAARMEANILASNQLFYEERGAAMERERTKDLTAEDLKREVKLHLISEADIAKMTGDERQAQILIRLRKFLWNDIR